MAKAEEVVWFMGVWQTDRAGHYWYQRNGRHVPWKVQEGPDGSPWEHVDGVLQPGIFEQPDRVRYRYGSLQHQGDAAFHRKGGWYCIAIWDSTGDSRGACNSNFLIRTDRTLTFEEAVALAREWFPHLWERMEAKFEIKLVENYV